MQNQYKIVKYSLSFVNWVILYSYSQLPVFVWHIFKNSSMDMASDTSQIWSSSSMDMASDVGSSEWITHWILFNPQPKNKHEFHFSTEVVVHRGGGYTFICLTHLQKLVTGHGIWLVHLNHSTFSTTLNTINSTGTKITLCKYIV